MGDFNLNISLIAIVKQSGVICIQCEHLLNIFMFVDKLKYWLLIPFCSALFIFSSEMSPRLFALCALWFELGRALLTTEAAGLVRTI